MTKKKELENESCFYERLKNDSQLQRKEKDISPSFPSLRCLSLSINDPERKGRNHASTETVMKLRIV